MFAEATAYDGHEMEQIIYYFVSSFPLRSIFQVYNQDKALKIFLSLFDSYAVEDFYCFCRRTTENINISIQLTKKTDVFHESLRHFLVLFTETFAGCSMNTLRNNDPGNLQLRLFFN